LPLQLHLLGLLRAPSSRLLRGRRSLRLRLPLQVLLRGLLQEQSSLQLRGRGSWRLRPALPLHLLGLLRGRGQRQQRQQRSLWLWGRSSLRLRLPLQLRLLGLLPGQGSLLRLRHRGLKAQRLLRGQGSLLHWGKTCLGLLPRRGSLPQRGRGWWETCFGLLRFSRSCDLQVELLHQCCLLQLDFSSRPRIFYQIFPALLRRDKPFVPESVLLGFFLNEVGLDLGSAIACDVGNELADVHCLRRDSFGSIVKLFGHLLYGTRNRGDGGMKQENNNLY